MSNFDYDELFKKIDLGVRIGAARALAEHKKAGRSIVVWKEGKVVKIPPEEIQYDESLLKNK
jgi:hypothetical protein